MRCETPPLEVCSLVWDSVNIHIIHIMVHLGQPRCCTMPMGRDLRSQEYIYMYVFFHSGFEGMDSMHMDMGSHPGSNYGPMDHMDLGPPPPPPPQGQDINYDQMGDPNLPPPPGSEQSQMAAWFHTDL